jgi:hypothetical protein
MALGPKQRDMDDGSTKAEQDVKEDHAAPPISGWKTVPATRAQAVLSQAGGEDVSCETNQGDSRYHREADEPHV